MGQLTPELRRYYGERFDMFASQGWKDLMTDLQEMLLATDQVSAVKDEKDLYFKKGELSIMRWLFSLQKVSEEAYDQLQREDNENSA